MNTSKKAARRMIEKFERFKKQQIEEILEEAEKQKIKSEKEKLNTTIITQEQLEKKLSESESPIIVSQSWGNAAPGGTLNYSVGIRNPDPVRQFWLFGHVFVGLANIVPDVGAAAGAVDFRFPTLTLPKFAGLSIDAGASQTLSYSIPVPATIESSNYIGNTFLFRATWHDVGEYMDRSVFIFEVT